MDALGAVGLGLDHGTLEFGRTTEAWLAAAAGLRDHLRAVLAGVTVEVETVGSSSVLGLLAKPIVDLAVGLGPGQAFPPVRSRLEAAGWIYRGDAGDGNGGHVFVLETRPGHRVAHGHVVALDGRAWADYLSLRDHLRRSAAARQQYERQKLVLAQRFPNDRAAYTEGKTEVVAALLAQARASGPAGGSVRERAADGDATVDDQALPGDVGREG